MQPNFVVSEINREGSNEFSITEKNLCEMELMYEGHRVQMTPTKREKKPLQCNFLVTFEIQAYVNAFSGYQWNLDQNAFSLNSFCFLYLGVFASTNFHFEIEHSS